LFSFNTFCNSSSDKLSPVATALVPMAMEFLPAAIAPCPLTIALVPVDMPVLSEVEE
jgi:hypothetical protein